MNRAAVVLIATMFAAGTGVPLAGQDHHHEQPVAGGGVFPAGWSARPDPDGGAIDNIKVVTMGADYHLTLGTSAIVYRQADSGKGPFHAVATFNQTRPSGEHPEGYGLFFGGRALDGADQRYVYFLVRADGQYLIKRRVGDEVTEVTPWTAHTAINQLDAKGQATNLLAIEAKPNAAKVLFTVNGQAVDSMTVTADDMNGVVGVRANHDLDLHLAGFAVHR
jgi:hypothetical protein